MRLVGSSRWVCVLVVLAACGGAVAGPPDQARPDLTSLPPVATTEPGAGSTTPTTTSSSTTHAPREPVVLGFAGDVSFTHGLDENDPLGGVAELLAAPDLMVVNLETTIAEPEVGSPLDKTYIFKSPPRSVDLLRAAGVDAVSLANNHTLDYRREGLLRTIQLLDEGGITHVGAGLDADMAYAPRVLDVGDWRVALVGFTHVECGWVADDLTRWPEAAWACPGFEQRTVTAVDQANRRADVVVVLVHWGIERDHCPQPYQRELAADWIEAGADLVIGSHPHVLQSVEQIGGAWVVHSTGNFAFPSARGPSARSAFFTATVSESGIALQATPVEIVAGRPHPMTADGAGAMLADLTSWSFGWAFDDAGNPSATVEVGSCDT